MASASAGISETARADHEVNDADISFFEENGWLIVIAVDYFRIAPAPGSARTGKSLQQSL